MQQLTADTITTTPSVSAKMNRTISTFTHTPLITPGGGVSHIGHMGGSTCGPWSELHILQVAPTTHALIDT